MSEDKVSEYHREYRLKNKDKLREYKKQWRLKNKEKVRESQKEYLLRLLRKREEACGKTVGEVSRSSLLKLQLGGVIYNFFIIQKGDEDLEIDVVGVEIFDKNKIGNMLLKRLFVNSKICS